MDEHIQQKVDEFFLSYPSRKFKKGHILIHANSEPDGIYYLVRGLVRQYDITETGSEVVVNVFKYPAFFPMSWAINKTPNRYFYEAFTDITVQQAPAEDVVVFLKKNSDIMYDLLSRLYKGTDGLQRRMAHLMGGTSQTRLLYELLIECKRFGKTSSNNKCVLEITEEEIANRAGLSRETVSRLLKKMKNEGLVKVDHGTLSIYNVDELQKRLGYDL